MNNPQEVVPDRQTHLIEAIERIYLCATDPSQWPGALQAVADYFDDAGANLIWRRDDGGFGVVVSPGLREATVEYEREWSKHDIRAIRGAERLYLAPGDAVTDRHVVTEEETRTHPFYTDFLARYGLRWVAAVGISPEPHVNVALSIQRSSDKKPFSDEELVLLTRIGRYAENALRLGMRLSEAETASANLSDALSRLSIGVFLLDGAGKVVFMNPKGRSAVDDGLEISGELLTARFALEKAALAAQISFALDTDRAQSLLNPNPVLVQRITAERPYAVYVLPARTMHDGAAASFLTRTRAIVLAVDSVPGEPPDPALVRDLLGLTLGEAKVAALVGSGTPPRDAAERLGITEETARTVLKRVFAKVGISRQSDLTALLAKAVLR